MTEHLEAYGNILCEAAYAAVAAAVSKQEYALVSELGLVPFKDGNAWCVLWGEDIQEGIAGFGSTPYKAVIDFNKRMHEE